MRLFLFIAVLALCTATAAPLAAGALQGGKPADTAAAAPSGAVSEDAQISEWIERLSSEPGFESWKRASWTKYPLGPGKRGWVVIVKQSGAAGTVEEAGYLVVVEMPGGKLQLEEYGVGEAPLFSMRTLERSLASEGLENVKFTAEAKRDRVYFDALHAYWKVTEGGKIRFADAKSGEWLPIEDKDVQRLKAANSAAVSVSKKTHLMSKNVADPYMSIGWITAKPLPVRGWNDLLALLGGNQAQLVYSADLYEGMMLWPFGVAGVHAWSPDGTAAPRGYVALEHEGLRYVPFDRLAANGTFRQ
ncbi:hypothetical protein [Paenibacillus alkalitolerans]|uniref:hypothetical protein n=1 Tax=Paenibacillus alkalitolerans TaxID=2799335 RepID=UPI0018F5D809|nr:hypothetical protein [Paenibacillus alkalitolerans]